jgi:uncharacterized RDD family membrane protein YckC
MNTNNVAVVSEPPAYRRAGLFLRLFAGLIDLVVVLVPSIALARVIGQWLPGPSRVLFGVMKDALTGSQTTDVLVGLAVMAQLILSVAIVATLYFLAEVLFGRTVGKLLVRLKISDTDGETASSGARWTRYAAKQAGLLLVLAGALTHDRLFCRAGEIVMYITALGFLAVLTRRRQALHDLIAGTVVHRRMRRQAAAASA